MLNKLSIVTPFRDQFTAGLYDLNDVCRYRLIKSAVSKVIFGMDTSASLVLPVVRSRTPNDMLFRFDNQLKIEALKGVFQ